MDFFNGEMDFNSGMMGLGNDENGIPRRAGWEGEHGNAQSDERGFDGIDAGIVNGDGEDMVGVECFLTVALFFLLGMVVIDEAYARKIKNVEMNIKSLKVQIASHGAEIKHLSEKIDGTATVARRMRALPCESRFVSARIASGTPRIAAQIAVRIDARIAARIGARIARTAEWIAMRIASHAWSAMRVVRSSGIDAIENGLGTSKSEKGKNNGDEQYNYFEEEKRKVEKEGEKPGTVGNGVGGRTDSERFEPIDEPKNAVNGQVYFESGGKRRRKSAHEPSELDRPSEGIDFISYVETEKANKCLNDEDKGSDFSEVKSNGIESLDNQKINGQKEVGFSDEMARRCFGVFSIIVTAAIFFVYRPGEENFERDVELMIERGCGETRASRRKLTRQQVRKYRAEYAYEMRACGIGS